MRIQGEGEVSRTLRIAGLIGLHAVKANVEGTAQMDLQIAGSWAGSVSGSSGFSAPAVTGTVQLHSLLATARGVHGPIEISSAELQLTLEQVRVEKLTARAAQAEWAGSVTLPRECGMPGACLVRFNLSTEEIGLADIYEWFGPQPSPRRWYQILKSPEAAPPSFLEGLRASGKVTARRFRVRNIVAGDVSAKLDLDRGKLKVSDLRADLLGGKHRGDWAADFSAQPPVYTGSGTLSGISLEGLADAMHDPWISGTAEGTYQLTATGGEAAAFWQSAEGGLQFDVRSGILPLITLESGEGPLKMERWQGHARLHGGKIEIEKGKLLSAAGQYDVSGSASLGQVLDFTLTHIADVKPAHASSAYSITGTVAAPHVALILTPETQARLKP
jgi:hypothetical protein